MKKKFIKLSRSDTEGSYLVPPKMISGAVNGELDGMEFWEPGTQIILEVVEMDENEFEELTEFEGW